MKKFTKLISAILVIAMLFTNTLLLNTKQVNADSSSMFGSYGGSYMNGERSMVFLIYSISPDDNSFSGYVYVDAPFGEVYGNVEGSVQFHFNTFDCYFEVKHRFFGSQIGAFSLTVHPKEGYVDGAAGGGALIESTTIYLTGTKIPFYTQSLLFNDDDMRMCMGFSRNIYSDKKDKKI